MNPRSRNRVTFHSITANIANVGLKKPITVYERAREDDGTKYDLIFGQGRLESVRELGDTMIPAIIKDVPKEDRYLMSLIENLARRPPSTTDILREVKRLRGQHYKPSTIAQKLGVAQSYIYGIMNLLRHGEEGLVASSRVGAYPSTPPSKSRPARMKRSSASSLRHTRTGPCVAKSYAPSNNSSLNVKGQEHSPGQRAGYPATTSCARTSTTPNSNAPSSVAPRSSPNASPFLPPRCDASWLMITSSHSCGLKDCGLCPNILRHE